MNTKKPIFNILHLWLLIPAIPFYAQVLLHAKNIPKEDDYDAIMGFLVKWHESSGWDRITLLFSQHNEHRILHSRIIYVLYDWICGGVNFRNLIIIGDLQLLGVGIIASYFCLKYLGKHREAIAAVWMIVLFDGQTYENANWAMTAIQNYGIIFLFLLSLFLYDRNSWWPGAMIQAIMIFSSGSGVLASGVITLFCFRRSRPALIASGIITLILSPAYFFGYRAPSNLPGQFPIDPTKAIDFFIQEVGAYWSFEYAFYIGFFLLVALLQFFPRKAIKENWLWICILLFVLGSMGTIAVFRGSAIGAKYQQSRYLMYPEMLTAILVLFISRVREGKNYGRLIMAAMLILLLRNYALGYKPANESAETSAWYLEVRKYSYPWNKAHADSISVKACEIGIYCIEDER